MQVRETSGRVVWGLSLLVAGSDMVHPGAPFGLREPEGRRQEKHTKKKHTKGFFLKTGPGPPNGPRGPWDQFKIQKNIFLRNHKIKNIT